MNIKIFHSEQFGDIRTTGTADEPLFCLSDVCKTLDLSSKHVRERLSDDVVSTGPIIDKLGRRQFANFVNEDGLYDVILDSRKPEAKAFRKWITSVVLPEIRKTGGYMVLSDDETPDKILSKALLIANSTLERLKAQNELQQRSIAESVKKAEYYDNVLKCRSAYLTDQIAKEMGMTAISLNRRLHDMGVQFKRNGQWVLTARYAGHGYTKTRTHAYTDENGVQKTSLLTVWTEKGRLFLHELFDEYVITIR